MTAVFVTLATVKVFVVDAVTVNIPLYPSGAIPDTKTLVPTAYPCAKLVVYVAVVAVNDTAVILYVVGVVENDCRDPPEARVTFPLNVPLLAVMSPSTVNACPSHWT